MVVCEGNKYNRANVKPANISILSAKLHPDPISAKYRSTPNTVLTVTSEAMED